MPASATGPARPPTDPIPADPIPADPRAEPGRPVPDAPGPAPYLAVFGAAVLWALLGLFSKGVLDAGVGAYEIAFWRALGGGAAFTLQAGLARTRPGRGGDARAPWRARDLLLVAAFGLIGSAFFYAALPLAIEAGGVSLAYVLMYSAPAWVAIGARLLLGEALGRRKAALIGLAIAGVALVATSGGSGGATPTPAAVLWGLAAGGSYASYYLFGKVLFARYAPPRVYALAMPLGALALLPWVRFTDKDAATWASLAAIALACTWLAYWLYGLGLRRVEASRAALVATAEPVLAAGLAAVAFGERLGAGGVIGAALVLGAALLSAMPTGRGRRGG